MSEGDEWTVNANEAIIVKLGTASFKPAFSYSIFGDNELIYGYQGLEIEIEMDPENLLQCLTMKYKKKLSGEKIDDPIALLKPHLADDCYFDKSKWQEARLKEKEECLRATGTTLPFTEKQIAIGQPELKKGNKLFAASLEESEAIHRRAEILVLLLIEAGSEITPDDKWRVYYMYEGKDFVGFCTVYQYFYYGGHAQFDSENGNQAYRQRISQFVILPPHQGEGLGRQLYKALVHEWLNDPRVKEITVEDPSEAFDDLRDRCDLERLAQTKEWKNLPNPITPNWIKTTAQEFKMSPRQYQRCLEMYLLLNKGETPEVKKLIWDRLKLRNKEHLDSMEDEEEKENILSKTYDMLVQDYERISESVTFSSKKQKRF